MSLTVLSDEDVRLLLEGLSHAEAEGVGRALKSALHEYSTGTQKSSETINQPARTVVRSSRTDATTLFMPSLSAAGHGVKVVTVSSPARTASQPVIPPTGSVTLFTPDGSPTGFLHAKTLTAFRTALASSCLLTKRAKVATLTVFGCGLQAYWHIRLALMLRGSTIRTVNIVARRFGDSAKQLLQKLHGVEVATKKREGGWDEVAFNVLTPTYHEYDRLLKDHVRSADVIYCCTPSTEPLFDATILTNPEGRRKGRLIVAIGSFRPGMRELPVELLKQATKENQAPKDPGGGSHIHFHKHATEGGVVVVDTLDGALHEAGEILDAKLEPRQLVELGELAMIQASMLEDEESSTSPSTPSRQDSAELARDTERLEITSASASYSSSALSSFLGSLYSLSDNSGRNGRGSKSSSKGGTSAPHSPRSLSRSNSGLGNLFHHRRRSSPGSSMKRKASPTPSIQTCPTPPPILRPPPPQRQQSQQSQQPSKQQPPSREEHLSRWLTTGNVIYKSVGLGLMDLVVGMEVVRLAQEKGLGSHIERFS